MRRTLFLLVLIITISGMVAASDWRQIPTGFKGMINGVYFCDKDNGFAVGPDGVLLRITPNSKKAQIDTLQPGAMLLGISFINNCTRGFICGDNGTLLESSDMGKSWSPQKFDTSFWFFDISFSDSLHGILVGANKYSTYTMQGISLMTSDGGKKWDSIPIAGRQLDNVDFAPDGIITVTGVGKIFISRDGGKTWESHESSGASVKAAAVRGNNGIMIGMGGFLSLSNDAGKTWKPYGALGGDIHLNDLLMLDSKRAYAVGSGGAIVYTDDAGRNWTPEISSSSGDLYEIRLIGKTIYACGTFGTIIYKDLTK